MLPASKSFFVAFSDRRMEYGVRQTLLSRDSIINDLNETNTREYTVAAKALAVHVDLPNLFRSRVISALEEAGLKPEVVIFPQSDKMKLPDLDTLGANNHEWVVLVLGPEIGYHADTMLSDYKPTAFAEVLPYNTKTKQFFRASFSFFSGKDFNKYPDKGKILMNMEESFRHLREAAISAAKITAEAIAGKK